MLRIGGHHVQPVHSKTAVERVDDFCLVWPLKIPVRSPVAVRNFCELGRRLFRILASKCPGTASDLANFPLAQLRIIQEVITLVVFAGIAVWVMGVKLTWNYLWAGLCMAAAVFFIFRDGTTPTT